MPMSEEQNDGQDSMPEAHPARGVQGHAALASFEIRGLNCAISCNLRQKCQVMKCQ